MAYPGPARMYVFMSMSSHSIIRLDSSQGQHRFLSLACPLKVDWNNGCQSHTSDSAQSLPYHPSQ